MAPRGRRRRPEDRRILPPAGRILQIESRPGDFPLPADSSDPEFRRRWAAFAERYRPAVEAYVAAILGPRGIRGPAGKDVGDVVSDFIASSMARGTLSTGGAGPVGSFRRLLLRELRDFVIGEIRKSDAGKRGGASTFSPFDPSVLVDPQLDAAADALSDEVVQIAVAEALVALRTVEPTYALVIEDLIATDGVGSPDIGRRLAREPGAMRSLRYHARARFLGTFVSVLREHCSSQAAFDELLMGLDDFLP